MKRREFITLLGGAMAAWPLAARGQQGAARRRIAVLFPNAENDPMTRIRVVGLEQSLARLGWVAGRNIRIEYRWGASEAEPIRAMVTELLAQPIDVILPNTSGALVILQQATRTVPIVFIGIAEPVGQGFVQSLAHPGGNTTGFSNADAAVGAKWLELVKEMAPRVRRVAFVFNPDNRGPWTNYGAAAAGAAPKLGVELSMVPVRGAAEIEAALTRIGGQPGGGLIFPPDGFMNVYRQLIIELAARNSLPAIYGIRNFTHEGGLAYYGVNVDGQYLQVATYVDRILRGEKPGDLPVQQPTKYEFMVNLKTAKTLGLTIPSSLLSVADELVE